MRDGKSGWQGYLWHIVGETMSNHVAAGSPKVYSHFSKQASFSHYWSQVVKGGMGFSKKCKAMGGPLDLFFGVKFQKDSTHPRSKNKVSPTKFMKKKRDNAHLTKCITTSPSFPQTFCLKLLFGSPVRN